jgi:hypothetical protein
MNSPLNVNSEERGFREPGARTARAEGFAAVSKALPTVKTVKPNAAAAEAPDLAMCPAAESQASDVGEIAIAGPQNTEQVAQAYRQHPREKEGCEAESFNRSALSDCAHRRLPHLAAGLRA